MADFSTDPALAIQAPPPAGVLDMAGKAAALHGQLLQNTGMGLEQHMTRLANLARMAATTLNPDGTADPARFAETVNQAVKLGLIQPTDGASAMLSAPKDPNQLGDFVRGQIAAAQKTVDAIAPHIGYLNTGDMAVPYNDNFAAKGGITAPVATLGMSPEAANAPGVITGANGDQIQATQGDIATRLGGNPHSSINGLPNFGPTAAPQSSGVAPIAKPAPIGQQPLAPSGQQVANDTVNALAGTTNPLTGKGPIVTSAATAMLRPENLKARNSDIAAGTDPNIGAAISSLQGIVAGADTALTAGNEWRSQLEKGLGALGMPIPTGSSDTDIMNKEQAMLVQQLGQSGPGTDAGMLQAIHTTPGSTMTPEAIKTTAALTLGLLKYKQALATVASGATNADTYNQVRSDFIANNPSPLMYAMPTMPKSQQAKIWKYVDKLPDAAQVDFVTKYQQVK